MKGSKPYSIIGEEDGSSMTAHEPAATFHTPEINLTDDYFHIPGLLKTWDELLDCLKEGEEEIERGEYVEWERAVQHMSHYRHYGS